MRKKKEQTVTLVVPKYNMKQEFGIQHAERLLDMGTAINGGWELPKDSNYIYDEENGLTAAMSAISRMMTEQFTGISWIRPLGRRRIAG